MIKQGTWWIKSKSDPRWNGSGRDDVGGFVINEKAQEHIDKLKKKLGEEPPEDLEYGCMKD
jgi:hypothetical protein